MKEIHEWICHALKCTNTFNKLNIQVEFNNRFTCRMGDASFQKTATGHRAIIRLSGPLWPRATQEQRRNTVIHEACHIIDAYLNGGSGSPHGRNWKSLMRQCGISNPSACHNVDRTGLKRNTKNYLARCGCRTHTIGKIRAKRIMSGEANYRCLKCNEKIRLINENRKSHIF